MKYKRNKIHKALRKAIWKRYGYSVRMWSIRHGFRLHTMQDYIRGKAGPELAERIERELRKNDLLEVVQNAGFIRNTKSSENNRKESCIDSDIPEQTGADKGLQEVPGADARIPDRDAA